MRKTIGASFRDPSGSVYFEDRVLYRQVNSCYKEDYDFLYSSGLYDELNVSGLLISHAEDKSGEGAVYKVIRPEIVPFISYPYEWCFSQLKDAALLTLKIQKLALGRGMSLKDCSAYNVQFRKGKPIFIDTLSFERYRQGQPWIAYRQFCQHFLAPLALMGYKDVRLNQLFRVFIDGVPLDLASSLLPFRTRFDFSLLTHIHLHAKSQNYFSDKAVNPKSHKISRLSFLGLIDSLETAISKFKWRPQGTEWSDYYEDTNYSADALSHKKKIVAEFFNKVKSGLVWDLGANTGVFSRIASDKAIPVISFDVDPAAVEKNYIKCVKDNETNILPLLMDLTNPSSGIGWENQERMSLSERGPADVAFALALIHHLAISNNLPLDKIANFFRNICKALIIEFVPKEDSQVQRLLSSREDIFSNYTQQAFEDELSRHFTIVERKDVEHSRRTVYLMINK